MENKRVSDSCRTEQRLKAGSKLAIEQLQSDTKHILHALLKPHVHISTLSSGKKLLKSGLGNSIKNNNFFWCSQLDVQLMEPCTEHLGSSLAGFREQQQPRLRAQAAPCVSRKANRLQGMQPVRSSRAGFCPAKCRCVLNLI